MVIRVSPTDAIEHVKGTDSIAVPLGPGVPGGFLHALAQREGFDDLIVYGALLPDLFEVFLRPGVRYQSGFFGPGERFLIDAGATVDFVPSDFRGFIPLLQQKNARIMATMAAPPDEDGYMSLSLHAGAHVDELHRAAGDPERLCVIETSPKFPVTSGILPEHGHRMHVDEVDIIIEGEYTPINLADAPESDVASTIATYAVDFVPDGATLQTGIGAIPNSIASALASGPGGGYGIHSEMFTSGLMRLCQSGKVTNENKGVYDGFSITTFAAGVPELYEFLDGNTEVRFLPVHIVNSPELISANENMVTINGAISVDLFGQVVADSVSGRQFSGIGGHEDFIAGASLELSDRSLICLPSTSTVNGERVSRIDARLPVGSIVTTPRHQVDVVITEHGVAELRGLTVKERARALAEIAHPDFRDELREFANDWT